MERPKHEVAVVPAGAWGAAFSIVAAEAEHNVRLYFRSEEDSRIFHGTHKYPRRHPEVVFPENIKAAGSSIEEALSGADIIVLAPPSRFLRDFYRRIKTYIPREASILCLTKGLEQGTNFRMSQVLEEEDPGISNRLAILSGPNLAYDVVRRQLVLTIVASTNLSLAEKMQMAFNTDYFRIYTTDDVKGVEYGAAFKNAMALAAGASDGKERGDSTKAALISRALQEMIRLAKPLGAREETLWGLSGLGDLQLTCTSPKSRNYLTGFEIARGADIEQLMGSERTVEGFYTVKAMVALAEKHGVDVPIAKAVYAVLYEGVTIDEVIKRLVSRPLIHENGRK